VKAILLAAGYATRLYPLTRDRPKPLLEVGGRPLLDHLLERIAPLPGLSQVIVVGNHRFAERLRAWARGAPCPVPLRVLDDGSTGESDRLGAVGDIAFALDAVPPADEDLLVAAGDNLIGFDLAPVHDRYLGAVPAPRPLLLVRRVERTGPSPYNEVELGPETAPGSGLHPVRGFREKPPDPRTPWAAIGVYFWPPEVAERLGRYLAAGGNPDAPGHFVEWLVRETPVLATPVPGGSWFDIGSPEALAAARAHCDRRRQVG